jgi:hypothetical protein
MVPTAVGLASEATLHETTPIRVSLQLAPLASRDVGFIRGSFMLSSRQFVSIRGRHSCPFAVPLCIFAALREILAFIHALLS